MGRLRPNLLLSGAVVCVMQGQWCLMHWERLLAGLSASGWPTSGATRPYAVGPCRTHCPCIAVQHFEDILKRNGGTIEAPGFLVGASRTAADLAVYHFLAAAQQHYRQYYDSIDAPVCKAFQQAIAERPNIKAYLSSDRCQPWDADSMM